MPSWVKHAQGSINNANHHDNDNLLGQSQCLSFLSPFGPTPWLLDCSRVGKSRANVVSLRRFSGVHFQPRGDEKSTEKAMAMALRGTLTDLVPPVCRLCL